MGHDLGRQVEVAEASHVGESDKGFEGAEEDASGLTIAEAGDVEAEVISVDEVDVDVAGRSEKDGVTKGASGGGVGGGIIGAEVGFGLDDASGEYMAPVPANEYLSEKFAADEAGIAIEEGTR